MFEDLFPEEQQSVSTPTTPPVSSEEAVPTAHYHSMPKPSNLFQHQEEMWDVIDSFEQYAWSAQNTGIPTGWTDFDKAFDGGLRTGWIIVAGDSNIGKCLAADSLIVDTKTGALYTIEELYRAQSANLLTLNTHLKLVETQPIAFIDDGIKPVYRVKTRLGREIKTTASHPFLTINGWKKLAEFTVGQHIAVPRCIPVFGNYDIPDHEVKLLAYLVTDGVTGSRVGFCNVDEQNVTEFIESVKAFDPNLHVTKYDEKKSCPTYQVHAQRGKKNTLLEQVRKWGINCLAIEKELPKEVFMLPKEKMALLLSRMFDCDGTIYETKAPNRSDVFVIGYSSSSKKLITQVQHLLLRFGIIAQLREKNVKYQDGYRQSWELEICDSENIIRFIECIGFFAKAPKAQAIYEKNIHRQKKGANKDIIPKEIWDKVKAIKEEKQLPLYCVGKVMGYEGRNAKDIPHNFVKNRRNAQRSVIQSFAVGFQDQGLMDVATSDIYWDEIVEIEYVGNEQVYDLTIPETHNFIANDICVHNTAFLSLMAWRVAQNNPDVYVLDFSLDDPLQDKIPRVVAAANKVLINAVRTPNNYTQYPEMLKRRQQGIELLRQSVDRYRCYDATHSTDIDDIEHTIQNTIVNLEEEAVVTGKPRRKLVVFIDNFHDLTTTAPEAMGSDKMKYDYLAQRISDMATKYGIPIITTAEFKKLNGYRRPSLDDIRESVKIKYEAKAILLCYNEVGLKGEAASIYYELQGKSQKQPVFEVKFGKNKMSSFKGRLFFEFYPDIAYFEPADKASTKRYNNLIYSND